MREMRNMPNGWEEIALNKLGTIVTGSTPDTSTNSYYNGNYMFVGPADLTTNKYITKSIKTLTKKGFNKTRNIPKNSLLITCIGELGKIAIATNDLATNQQLNSIICDENYNYEFIYYSFLYNKTKLNQLAGLQVVPLVNKTEFGKITIFIPKSKKEQEKIAEILSEVDSAIEHAQALHVKHQKIKTALMQDLLTHGIDSNGKIRNPKTHAYKPSPLGDIPVEWDVKELKKILKIGSGQDYKFLQKGAIPVYGTGGYMTSVNNFLHDGESVCIGRKGTIDNPMYLEGKFWTVDTLFYTHKFKQSVPKYIYYVFQNINWKLYNEASGVPSLSKTTIENIQIKIPQQEEQQKITQILSSQDDKIERVKTKLEKLQQLKTALMQDLLSGTKRVNHLLGEEQ